MLYYEKSQIKEEINDLVSQLNSEKRKCFGIQMNQETEDCIDFSPLLQHTINNLGDPFLGHGTHLDTFEYERKLIFMMAEYLNLNPDDSWGYYTSGSSISNLHAMHVGYQKLDNEAILITSEDAHNSIIKAGEIVRIKKTIKIKVNDKGEIDLNHFEEILKLNKGQKIIFFFCSGTVSKGAYDDIKGLINIIKSVNIEKYYLHLDAALGGLITPFLNSKQFSLDFSIPEINSMSVSFHKRLGIPIPGSLFIMNKAKFNIMENVSYVEDYSSFDTTIPGSRDGLSPLITYFKLRNIGYNGMVERTKNVIDKASWFTFLLKMKGIAAFNNENSPCVYFEAPNQEILKEYHLPLYRNSNGLRFTHIFTMEHVTKDALSIFLKKIN